MSLPNSEPHQPNPQDEARKKLFNLLVWQPALDIEPFSSKEYFELRQEISQANHRLLQILEHRDKTEPMPGPSPLLKQALSKTAGVKECLFKDAVDPDGYPVTYHILTGGPETKATLIIEYEYAVKFIGPYTASESMIRKDPDGKWSGFFDEWKNKPFNKQMISALSEHVNNLWTLAKMPDS